MKGKGLVALLDGLLAYTVAFTAIGLITLLIIDPRPSDMETAYTLGAWANDIANAIGPSMTQPFSDNSSKIWRNIINVTVLNELNHTLSNISQDYGLIIDLTTLDATNESLDYMPVLAIGGNINDATEVAMATRLMIPIDPTNVSRVRFPDNNGVSMLIIKVGKK